MKNREDFYSNEFNSERAEEALRELCKKCTFTEISWIMRNITYDQVAYYSEDLHSKIYDDKDYSEKLKEDLNAMQRAISARLDLFEQMLIRKNSFNSDYINKYLDR